MAVKKRIRSPYCTNCGKVLQEDDNYCPNCGQENDIKRQSFGKVMSELVIGFLSIESRLAHSLPAILFKPAFLTKEYLKGRRQRYLDPIRMFLTIVVIYFLLASFGNDNIVDQDGNIIIDSTGQFKGNPNDTIRIVDEGPLQFNITNKQSKDSSATISTSDEDTLELDDKNYSKIQALIKSGITDDTKIMDSLKIEDTFWNRFYYHEIIKFAKTNFKDLKAYFISKLPWIIFSLIPIFALLLKVIYFRRKFLYIDHLIFAFHLHSFYFLIGIIHNIISRFTGYEADSVATLATIIYSIGALKNFYNQGFIKTILKSIILFMTYFMSVLICLFFIAFVMFIFY